MSAEPSPETATPADPARYRLRGRGPGPLAFWLFGLGCLVLGVLLALVGSRLVASRPHPPALVDAPASTAPAPGPAPAAPAVAAAGPNDGELDQLNDRLGLIEQRADRTSQAASAALAAAAVVEASQQAGPFAQELAALRGALPDSPELAALSVVAASGAPTRAALAESYPDYAARAASASRAPGDGAGLGDRIVYVLSRIVTVRRVAETGGNRADTLLARAERQLEDGDLDAALATLDGLPANAREAMAPWRARAERRAQIDRAARALRARALRDLAGVQAAAG